MKLSTIASLLLLLVSIFPGEAVFGNPFVDSNGNPVGGGSFTNPDFFNLANILRCSDDNGGRLNVNLVPSPTGAGTDFDYFLPEASGYVVVIQTKVGMKQLKYSLRQRLKY